MNRRLFGRVFAGLLGVVSVSHSPALPSRVKLVSYVDASYVGNQFDVIGFVDNPRVMNRHYRPTEQLLEIRSEGVALHVYPNEVVPA